jgi:hypothetical protein
MADAVSQTVLTDMDVREAATNFIYGMGMRQ